MTQAPYEFPAESYHPHASWVRAIGVRAHPSSNVGDSVDAFGCENAVTLFVGGVAAVTDADATNSPTAASMRIIRVVRMRFLLATATRDRPSLRESWHQRFAPMIVANFLLSSLPLSDG